MLLPFANALFGHVMAAMFLTGCWLLVRGPSPSTRALLGAGVLMGASVGTEFTAVIPGVVIVVAVLVANRMKPTAWLALGGAVGTLPLLVYNWLAFDNPFKTAYQGSLANFKGSGAFGVYNLEAPKLEELQKAMIGDRGLLTLTPICALAIAGAVIAIVQRTATRSDAVMGLVILVLMWLMSAGIDGYGGASPGPRYLIPALPFLAIPLAEAWRRYPRLCSATALAGAIPMIAATMTAPLLATDYTQSLRYWLDRLGGGRVARSVPGELFGDWALYAVVVVGLACAATAILLDRPPSTD